MARREKRRRPGLWDWLMGREPPGRPAPSEQPPPGDDEQPLAAAPAAPPTSHPAAAQPCPICGGSEFRWGWLETGLYGIGKGPAGADRSRWVKPKTRFGDFIGLRARMCVRCGHVDAFASDVQEGC